MSNSRSNFSSSSYTSFSSVSSSSGSTNGGRSGQTYSSHSTSGPQGTTTHTTTQILGQPAVQETKHYDNQGRQLLDGGFNAASSNQRRIQDIEVEDVTDQPETEADKRYRAAMEDEYAKREGGA